MEGGVMFLRKMKPYLVLMLIGFLAGCATTQTHSEGLSASSGKLHHLVIVWLKQSGDESVRQRYIKASQPLAKLPGVLAYHVGTPASIKRSHTSAALDESYDVAIVSVYENQQAFEAFLKNPEYGRVAKDVLKPLVAKYQVYDFLVP